MTDRKELAQKAIVMAVLADMIGKQKDAYKRALDPELESGDRVGVPDPTDPDVRLGMVYRTEGKASAVVTDEGSFLLWHMANHPDRVETVLHPDVARSPEVAEVLARHAPDLLVPQSTVADWAREEVLKATVKAREPVGPHGELDDQAPPVRYVPARKGVITVKPDADAGEVIGKLWAQGRIDISTGEILELESGE